MYIIVRCFALSLRCCSSSSSSNCVYLYNMYNVCVCVCARARIYMQTQYIYIYIIHKYGIIYIYTRTHARTQPSPPLLTHTQVHQRLFVKLRCDALGTHFTSFTGTKVHLLTQTTLLAAGVAAHLYAGGNRASASEAPIKPLYMCGGSEAVGGGGEETEGVGDGSYRAHIASREFELPAGPAGSYTLVCSCRCSIYLLYWYKRTYSDAEGGAGGTHSSARAGEGLLLEATSA